jgi:hypothetical protein
MKHSSGLCTCGQKWIKTKMKTPIRFNTKGNEVITWCSLNIWSCLLLNNHHRCLCYCRWCSLHNICASWVSDDDVHQGSKVVSSDKDIHSSLGVARKKVGDFPLSMCSILQNNSCNSILKCIVGYCMFTLLKAPKQMGTLVVNGITTLTPWKRGNYRMWQAKTST